MKNNRKYIVTWEEIRYKWNFYPVRRTEILDSDGKLKRLLQRLDALVERGRCNGYICTEIEEGD